MRVVRTGTNPSLDITFVKNYLKIDPDITIEDDVVQAAMDAALDETTELLMYIPVMGLYSIILPEAETVEKMCLNTVKPVQKMIQVLVQEWDMSGGMVNVSTLTETTHYTYEIDKDQVLIVELTESGKEEIDKGQYLTINVLAGEYETINDVPASIVKAMLKMIADMVENRVDVENIKSGDWRSSDRQIWLRRQWRF